MYLSVCMFLMCLKRSLVPLRETALGFRVRLSLSEEKRKNLPTDLQVLLGKCPSRLREKPRTSNSKVTNSGFSLYWTTLTSVNKHSSEQLKKIIIIKFKKILE